MNQNIVDTKNGILFENLVDEPDHMPKNIEAIDIPEVAKEKYPDANQVSQGIYDDLLKDISEEIVSVTVNSAMILKTELELFNFLISKKDMMGITICLDRPASYYIKLLKSRDLNSEMIYFIDAITLFSGKKSVDNAPNIVFIENPADITAIDIAITKIIEYMEQHFDDREKFLLLSCVPTLLLYVESERLGIFLHDQASKLRMNETYGIILLQKENDGMMLSNTIKSFCDNNIELSVST